MTINENKKQFLKFDEFLNEMLIVPKDSSYLDSVIEFVKKHEKPTNNKEFTEKILKVLTIRRTQNVGKVADIYKNLIEYVNSLLKSKTYMKLDESVNESLTPDKEVHVGDIVTIYGKRSEQKKIGDSSFEMGGSYIGKKEFALEIVVAEVGKNDGRNVIYKSYFLDGKELNANVNNWYSTQKGKGEKYLQKFEK